MKHITDKEFKRYGKLRPVHDFIGAIRFVESVPIPKEGLYRVESDPVHLESLKAYGEMSKEYFAGLPLYIGYSVGNNTSTFPMRYHKSSTIFVAVSEITMGFCSQEEKDDIIQQIEWFSLPARTIIEVFGSVVCSSPIGMDGEPVRLIEAYAGVRDSKVDTTFEWECDAEVQFLASMNTWTIECNGQEGEG